MLTKMQLDLARMTLLTGFFETYLKLNQKEEQTFEAELHKLNAEEAQKMMEITTSWHEKGRMEGFIEGEAAGIIKGKMEGKMETARNMLLDGMPVAKVVKLTKLPEVEIAKLQQKMQTSEH